MSSNVLLKPEDGATQGSSHHRTRSRHRRLESDTGTPYFVNLDDEGGVVVSGNDSDSDRDTAPPTTSWQQYEDEDGDPFFVNIEDDSTAWELPLNGIVIPRADDDLFEPVQPTAQQQQPKPGPPRYRRLESDEGEVYFLNLDDDSTMWALPDGGLCVSDEEEDITAAEEVTKKRRSSMSQFGQNLLREAMSKNLLSPTAPTSQKRPSLATKSSTPPNQKNLSFLINPVLKPSTRKRESSTSSATPHGTASPRSNTVPSVKKTYVVGDRVWVTEESLPAMVKFVGHTSFSHGVWIGCELTNATDLGKNSGNVKGVQYFKCSPKKGLFVRVESRHLTIDERGALGDGGTQGGTEGGTQGGTEGGTEGGTQQATHGADAPEKVYLKGVLGKYARARKRHTIQKKGIRLQFKNWKQRYFVLRGNQLEYYKNEKAFLEQKPRNGGIRLMDCDYVPKHQGNEIVGQKHMFELRRDNAGRGANERLLKMFTHSLQEREMWIEAIQQCVLDLDPKARQKNMLADFQQLKVNITSKKGTPANSNKKRTVDGALSMSVSEFEDSYKGLVYPTTYYAGDLTRENQSNSGVVR